MRTTHLVVGASGQVGSHLLSALQNLGEQCLGTYHRRSRPGLIPLDLEHSDDLKALLAAEMPSVVWMPAALPDVDLCEREPELSHRINVGAVSTLAEASRQIGARFVFYSTDYVFDGTHGPYFEGDAAHPLQVYGRHKLEAETWLLEHLKEVLIIRTAWVYSQEANPRNFIYRIEQQLQSGNMVKAATDQVSTPTEAQDLAKRSIQAVREGMTQILHVVGPNRLSRYDWTVALAQQFGYSLEVVQPVLTQSIGLLAARPLNGGLATRYSR